MPEFVEIAVIVPQAMGLFHYHLPPELEGRVTRGCLVVVPFGAQRVQGVVIRPVEIPAVAETRPVLELVDPFPVLTGWQMSLAMWMSETYLAPLAPCIERMLPPGLAQHGDTLFHLIALDYHPAGNRRIQDRLVALLKERGDLRGRQIDRVFPHVEWRPSMYGLVRRGIASAENYLPPPTVQAKVVRTAQLACPPGEAIAAVEALGRPGSEASQRRRAVVARLVAEPMPVEVPWVFAETGASMADLQFLAERGLITLGVTEAWRDPLENLDAPLDVPPPLTGDQQAAWATLRAAINRQAELGERLPPFLLHGVTGSGKTEIYLRAVEETLRLGRQALVLVPEIALTPQTVRRFVARFPGQVGLIHSRLSDGERYDTWRRARLGLLRVIVGPRSAVFAPLEDPGLIVIDECHDESYYQDEAVPYHYAVATAVKLADLNRATCLLGSATPNVVTSYWARRGRWRVLALPSRVLAHRQAIDRQAEKLGLPAIPYPTEGQAAHLELPPVKLVDMRRELKEGNRQIFSRALVSALDDVLEAGQQAILFLNRRGTATYVFCRECGEALHCPNCDTPLTYHHFQAALVCHYCGFERPMPRQCPVCGSDQIRQFGTGTEKVEREVQELFPGVRTLRWDAETTRKRGAHEVILAHFAAHRADVLVGTQMLAKGLDLPFVTLVGVILADVGLALPDYRAAERTFQVLTQVAGRAGRSPLGGRVIFQTFLPDHYAIRAAAGHDYEAFYRTELAYRRQLGYPPFYRLVRLEYRHPDPERAERAAHDLAGQLAGWLSADDRRATQMIGPAPCFFGKLCGQYRWQIVLRGPEPASLLRGRPLGDWHVEVDPPNLL